MTSNNIYNLLENGNTKPKENGKAKKKQPSGKPDQKQQQQNANGQKLKIDSATLHDLMSDGYCMLGFVGKCNRDDCIYEHMTDEDFLQQLQRRLLEPCNMILDIKKKDFLKFVKDKFKMESVFISTCLFNIRDFCCNNENFIYKYNGKDITVCYSIQTDNRIMCSFHYDITINYPPFTFSLVNENAIVPEEAETVAPPPQKVVQQPVVQSIVQAPVVQTEEIKRIIEHIKQLELEVKALNEKFAEITKMNNSLMKRNVELSDYKKMRELPIPLRKPIISNGYRDIEIDINKEINRKNATQHVKNDDELDEQEYDFLDKFNRREPAYYF